MELLYLLSILLIPISYLIFFRSQKPRRVPPGPPAIPFIGNLLQRSSDPPHIYLAKLARKYGPIMSMKFGTTPVLVFSSAKYAEEVMKTQDMVFCSRPRLHGQQKLTYNGSNIGFGPYGETWRELKKIAVGHLLNVKQVQSYRNVRETQVSDTLKKIAAAAEAGGGVANLSTIILSHVSSQICRIAFGTPLTETGLEKKNRFHGLMKENQAMLANMYVASYIPLFGWIDKLTGANAKLERVFDDMDNFFQELIDSHMDPKRDNSLDKDILALLIQLKEQKTCAIDLTWDNVKGILADIFIAATDTGAATVIWAMTYLLKNPSTMKKLQEEIRSIVPKGQGKVSEDDIPKLVYLKAVIKETLRICPPAPLLLPREAQVDCVIDDYEIKAGTLAYVNAWAIARDANHWENPDEFVPERFLNSTVDVRGQHFQMIPFGAGRRMCPGMTMGLASLEITLANLIYAFNWELPKGMKKEDIDTDVARGIAVHKKVPLCLVPKKYEEEKY